MAEWDRRWRCQSTLSPCPFLRPTPHPPSPCHLALGPQESSLGQHLSECRAGGGGVGGWDTGPGEEMTYHFPQAEEELVKAQKVFEEMNVDLQEELPSLWNRCSRRASPGPDHQAVLRACPPLRPASVVGWAPLDSWALPGHLLTSPPPPLAAAWDSTSTRFRVSLAWRRTSTKR